LNDDELRQRRDQLHGIFAAHWPIIGWNLQRARKPLHITDALRPLASLNHPTIGLLLLDSFKMPMADGFPRFRQERNRLYSQLEEARKKLSEANTKVMEARSAFEQAHNWFAVARDSYIARKKEKDRRFFPQGAREVVTHVSLCGANSAGEKNLIEYTEKIRGIEKEIKMMEWHILPRQNFCDLC
jgi:hypothetical protein